MSGLIWRLRRLRAMSAGEILHRVRNALRARLAPPAWELWTSLEAADRLFERPEAALAAGPGSRLVHPDALEGADARVLEAGRRLREGRWSLFGHEVRLDDPPDWNRNYRTGAAWPDVSARRVDHRRADIAGGVKWTWELGRLTMLPTLALAARRSGDDALAARCERWLADWNESNPLGHGIHYTSGIEMAVRVLTMQWTLSLLGERFTPDTVRASLGVMAQKALHCRDHLSLGSSANNHLIAEYAAMTVMGAAHPSLRGAAALLDRGLAGLERETLAQLHEDGTPAEQAFGYLPFIWELLLLPFLAAEAAGRRIDPAVRARLAATLAFARDLRLPNGRLPSIGDEDDARVLLAELDAPRLDLVGGALAAWLGEGAAGLEDSARELALLLAGSVPAPAAAPRQGELRFPHGGYAAWRHGDLLVTFDHGPLGYGPLAAHGHADALAITLHAGAVPLIADPGTFSYQDDPVLRDRCRSTPVHATVHFGGRSQSEMLGPFLWGRRARVEARASGATCTWWTGERHTRELIVNPGCVQIADRAQGAAAALSFPLPPAAEVRLDGATASVEVREHDGRPLAATRAMRITTKGIESWTLEDAEHASNFGRLASARRLAARLTGVVAKTVIEVRPS